MNRTHIRITGVSLVALLLFLLASCATRQRIQTPQPLADRTFTFLSVNDIHANLDNFPRLAFMVDSLRAIYPEMALVSAGDNQTGHPMSDQYTPKGLPVIKLMNATGFDMSALGNHEFDAGPKGFAYLNGEAEFDFLCANILTPSELPFNIKPYKILHPSNGLKIAVVSLLQINNKGIPDCMPVFTEGFKFADPFETAKQYIGMKDSCDALVFLTHLGIEADGPLAEQLPSDKVDLIIGGHSHTKIDKEEFHNGIMVTQAQNKLKHAGLIMLTVTPEGKVTPHMQLLTVGKEGNQKKEISEMVDFFKNNNPGMTRRIATLAAPIRTKEKLGYLMADAFRHAADVDITVVNCGGVRMDSWDKTEVTPYDVYMVDPFGNEIVTINLTGDELYAMYEAAYYADDYHYIFASGLSSEYYENEGRLSEVRLFTPDGQPVDRKHTYKVAMNSYFISATKFAHSDKPVTTNVVTAENMIDYLAKKANIEDYNDVHRLKIVKH